MTTHEQLENDLAEMAEKDAVGISLEYLHLHTVGVTSICDFLESPKHFHYYRIQKKRDETPAMREGIQFHSLVLEPEKFYASYFTDLSLPEGMQILKTVDDMKEFITAHDLKPKGKKEDLAQLCHEIILSNDKEKKVLIYDDWVEMNTRDKEFISKPVWDRLHEMRDSVVAHEFTKRHLPFATKEMMIEGEIEGFHVRGRLDWFVNEPELPYIIVIDVKKTPSAKFHRFRNVIVDNWHFVQAALYCKLVEMKYKRPVLYVWLACEGHGPKICEAYSANDACLEAGEKAYMMAFKRLHECLKNDKWPGYSDGLVNNMDLPSFMFDRVAEMESEEQ